ncbi:MAG: hypothetical protein WHT45_02945 [Ignavibacterium sp.]
MPTLLRKFLVYVIVLSYLSGINAYLVSWLEYNFNYDFIIKYLCVQKDEPENMCHGSCHLKANLENNEETNKPAERPSRETNNFNISFHLAENSSGSEQNIFKLQRYFPYNSNNFQSTSLQPDSPPPKLIS